MGIVITLLVIGAVLLLVETMLPGMISGILGFGCLVAAVVMSYSELGPRGGNLMLLLVAVGLVAGMLLWMKYFPESPMARLFVSKAVIGNIDSEKPDLLNQAGLTHTKLRPSGTAIIQGKRVDVVAEGSFVDQGRPIKVVGLEGMRVVVREISDLEWKEIQETQKTSNKS